LIVKEAGGEVTDVWGVPLEFSNSLKENVGVIATMSVPHHIVLDKLRCILKTHIPV
jgi:3'-phosphoadenosine 5'-phosphosulfate (PAPS) 3'-phosphatase